MRAMMNDPNYSLDPAPSDQIFERDIGLEELKITGLYEAENLSLVRVHKRTIFSSVAGRRMWRVRRWQRAFAFQ